MSGNSVEWRHAPRRTRALAAVAVGLVLLGVWWLALVSSKARRPESVLVSLGLVFLALGIALVAIVCVIEYGRFKRAGLLRSVLAPPFDRPWPLVGGTAWIGVDPEVGRRNLRMFRMRLAAAAAITIVGAIAVVSLNSHRASQWFVGVFFAACTTYAWVFLIIELRVIRRARAMRIGTDGVNALFDAGDGDIESVSLDTVRVDDYSILIGRRILGLSDSWRRTTFPPDALRGILLARLREDAFVRNGWLALNAIARGNVRMLASALGLIVAAVWLIMIELRPDALEAMVKAFAQWLIERAR